MIIFIVIVVVIVIRWYWVDRCGYWVDRCGYWVISGWPIGGCWGAEGERSSEEIVVLAVAEERSIQLLGLLYALASPTIAQNYHIRLGC